MKHSFHSARLKRFMRKPLISLCTAGTILFFYPMHSFSAPTDGLVVKGSAAISQSGLSTIIDQGSARAVIDWRGFDISANERVQFNQVSSSAIALNRITGGNPTTILGQLAANGRVFISNPNGVVFGAGSQVDVASLLATTLSVNADDFMAGKNAFTQASGFSPSFVVNQGEIRIADNGFCFLVASGVQNSGTIIGQLGKVVMASGDALTLDFNGDGLVTYTVSGKVLESIIGPDGKPFDAAVSNTGTITAPGGNVVLVGNGAKDVFSSVVNNSGLIEATSLVAKGGEVALLGGDEGIVQNTGTIDVSAAEAAAMAGHVAISGQYAGNFGTISAKGATGANGGLVEFNSTIHTLLGSSSFIDVSGQDNSSAGSLLLRSDNHSSFGGQVLARGGDNGGDGGFVDVSSLGQVDLWGTVDALAPAGKIGTLLIDPKNIIVATSGGSAYSAGSNNLFTSNSGGDTIITPTSINSSAATVVLQATSDITVNEDIAMTGNAGAGLTMQAGRSVAVNANISTSGNNGAVSITANDPASGANAVNRGDTTTPGSITMASGTTINTGSGNITLAVDPSVTSPFMPGGITVANLTTTGDVTLSSVGSITEAASSTITGAIVNLTTTGGTGSTVGTDVNPLKIDATTLNVKTTNAYAVVEDTAGGVALDQIDLGTGTFILTATDGAITAGTGDVGGINIKAGHVNLTTSGVGGGAIGTSLNPLRTSIVSLTATTNNGGIYDVETDALIVNNVTAKESIVSGHAGVAPMLGSGGNVVLMDGSTTKDGTFDVSITGGDIVLGTVLAPRNVTIQSSGLIIDGNVEENNIIAQSTTINSTGSGNRTFNGVNFTSAPIGQSTDAIELTTETLASSTTDGSIYLSIANTATISSVVAGNLPTKTGSEINIGGLSGNLTLGSITAEEDTVTLSASGGKLLSGTGSLITGKKVDLTAQASIGASTTDTINTQASQLDVEVTKKSGGTYISNTGALTDITAKVNDGDISITSTSGLLSFTASNNQLAAAASASITFENTADGILLGSVDASSTGTATITAYENITGDASTMVTAGTATLSAKAIGTATSSDTAIKTAVDTLTATASNGGVYATNSKALTLIASATGSGNDIMVATTSGNLTLQSVTAPDVVTLNAAGNILDGNDPNPADGANAINNITSTSAVLSGSAIGASGNVIETTVDTLTAAANNGGVYVANSTAMTLTVSASGSDNDIAITSNGDMTLKTVSAPDLVTLTSTGQILDGNIAGYDITAHTATLSATQIGASGDHLETAIDTLTLNSTAGGTYIDNTAPQLTLTSAVANGSGADIYINNTGTNGILLGQAIADGDTVTLISAGDIGLAGSVAVNVKAKKLDIQAAGKVSSSLKLSISEISGSAGTPLTLTNSDPLAITASTLAGGGFFSAPSITILDLDGGTDITPRYSDNTVSASSSLTLKTTTGNIVFLDPNDTISSTGSITIDAGGTTTGNSGAVAIIGNLKTTNNGAISVKADGHISIGTLDAGTGSVTVGSNNGMIIDALRTDPHILAKSRDNQNIIAGSATLYATTPTASVASLFMTNSGSLSAAAQGEEDAKLLTKELSATGASNANSWLTTITRSYNTSVYDLKLKTATYTKSNEKASDYEDVAFGLNLLSVGLTIASKVSGWISAPAQAVPVSGDGGATTTTKTLETAAGVATAVSEAASSYARGLRATANNDQEVMRDAVVYNGAMSSDLAKASSDYAYWSEAKSVSAASYEKAQIASASADQVYALSRVANKYVETGVLEPLGHYSPNAIGNPSAPLVIKVPGRVDITANYSNVYLNTVGNVTLGDISASNNRVIGPSAVVVSGTGDVKVTGTVSTGTGLQDIVKISTTGGNIYGSGGSDLISSPNFIATATAGIGYTGVLHTHVDNFSASGGGQGVSISNDKNLLITPVVDNAIISESSDGFGTVSAGIIPVTPYGSGNTPAVLAAGGTSAISTTNGGDITVAQAVTTSGDGNITLDAAGNLVLNAAVTANESGNILLKSSGTGKDVTVATGIDVTSGSGNISVIAANNVTFNAGADIGTGGTGSIDVEATTGVEAVTGTILLSPTSNVSANAGDIRLFAANDVNLGQLISTTGNVSITATVGNIIDNYNSPYSVNDSSTDPAANDITASGLILSAGKAIGSSVNRIETNVSNLSTSSGYAVGAGTFILEASDVTVSGVTVQVNRVASTGTTATITDHQADLVTGNKGNIVLQTTNGSITLTDGDHTGTGASGKNGIAVSANGTGNILIEAIGAADSAASITATDNADITSGTGNITLLAKKSIDLQGNVDVTTAGFGTMEIEATTGSFTMATSATLNSVDGDIRIHAGDEVTDQLTIGLINATNANVSLLSSGSILDSDAAGDTNRDIYALGLRVEAGKGFGLLSGNSLSGSTNAIETKVNTVSALVKGSDGFNMIDEDGVTVADIISPKAATDEAVTVNRVKADATTEIKTDAKQSDIITSNSNGGIVLRTTNGNITLNDGTAIADNTAISANGTGNILVEAIGSGTSITSNADVISGTGNISVLGAQDVIFTANADITTGGSGVLGTIDIEAGTGSIDLSTTSNTTSTGGDIRMLAATNVNVGGLISTSANVSITATTGTIYDNDGNNTTTDISSSGLRLWAGTGVGVLGGSVNPIETTVTTLSGRATSGGINILETDGLTVDNTSATIQRVNADASASTTTDTAQSDVVTTNGNGSIVLRTTAGNIVLNDGTAATGANATWGPLNYSNTAISANGTGNILVEAIGAGTSITGNADITSSTGNITLLGAQDVIFTDNADITTGGSGLLGTIDIEAGTGSIDLSTTSNSTSTGGDIRMLAATTVNVGSLISTSANVSITATTGTIYDNDGNNTTTDISSSGLRLWAGTGVGVLGGSVNPIETTVTTLSGRATSGGINILETDGLTVDNTSATIQRVNADAGVTATTDTAQSDMVTTDGNGSIVLRTMHGNITLNDGTAVADNTAISANGTGNILVEAIGAGTSITSNADIISSTGNITLLGTQDVIFTDNADITTGGSGVLGTIDIEAGTGSIDLSTTSNTTSTGGDIRMLAATNVNVGSLISTSENVSITATTGTIYDNDGNNTTTDILSSGLRLWAGTGVGVLGGSVNPIETTVTTLSARAKSGGINILETDVLTVDNTSATIQRVNADASSTATTDTAQSDVVTTGGNGSIVLRTTAGNIVLNDGTAATGANATWGPLNYSNTAISANGTGNILVEAIGAGTSITGNADITSSTGNITLLGAQDVILTDNADITTGGSGLLGTIDIEAGSGSIDLSTTSNSTSTGGDIRMLAATNVNVGSLISTSANVSITATTGTIYDNDGNNTTTDISSSGLRLWAGTGVGVLGGSVNPIETTVTTLSGRATSGGINILETDGLTVDNTSATIQRVNADAGVTATTDTAQSDMVTTDGNGSIVLRTMHGNITLNDGTAVADNTAISANGTGNILVEAIGAGTSITSNADIISSTGNITLLGTQDVIFTDNADITTGGSGVLGTIDIEAGTGSIDLSTTSNTTSTGGDIRMLAATNVNVGGLISTNANVSITATTGTIYDNDGNDTSVDIASSGLRLWGGTGVGVLGGSVNPIETTVTTLSGRATSGGINILETDGLTVDNTSATIQRVNTDASASTTTDTAQSDVVTTNGNGSIVLRTKAGSIVLNDGTAATGANATWGPLNYTNTAVSANGTGNILVESIGSGTSITSNADITSNAGNITLLAKKNIDLQSNVDVTTTGNGTMEIEASTGSFTMATSAILNSVDGDIRIHAGDDVTDQLTIGLINATNANVSLLSSGSILDSDTAGDANRDIYALGLRIEAGKGFGLLSGNSLSASANAIETEVDKVSALVKGSDGLNMIDEDGVIVTDITSPKASASQEAVTVNRVKADATTEIKTDAKQSDIITSNSNGGIVLRTTNGNITLNDGTAIADNTAISANGTGNILVEAIGSGTSVTGKADIISSTGNITLLGAQDVIFTDNADITTGGSGVLGTIDIEAGTGSINLSTTSNTTSTGGDIRMHAANDVNVGGLISTGANVSITATAGTIYDNDGNDTTVDISSTGLRLWAGTGVGVLGSSVNPLETTVTTLSARGTSGGINIHESDDLIVGDTSVTVQKVGSDAGITATTDAAQSGIVATESGDISLFANNNVTLGGMTATTGNVSITALTGWIHDGDSDGSNDISATGLRLDAAQGIGSSANWIEINAVNLNASTLSGSIYLNDIAGGVAVGLVTTAGTTSGEVNLTATNGSITESGSDSEADIVGNTLNLAVTGPTSTIGTVANTLEINAVNLNASTSGGNIYLNDIAEGVAVGLVTTGGTTSGTVSLTASNGSLLEWGSDPEADIVGETLNLVVTGPTSTIGSSENILEVDAGSNTLNAKTSGGNIYLNEILGDASIGLIDAGGKEGGQVYLIVTDGGITESGTDPEADIVGKSVILVVNEKKGAPVGDPKNMLEISSPELNIENPEGNTYVDLNGTAGTLLFNELPEGMNIDRAHLPALLVFNSRIIGGDQIDRLLHAEAEFSAYQFQNQQPQIFRDLLLPTRKLPADDDENGLSLVDNVIK